MTRPPAARAEPIERRRPKARPRVRVTEQPGEPPHQPLGYLWGQVDGGDCLNTVSHSEPERFVIWRPNNGAVHCRPNEGSLVSGGRKQFMLRDTDQDTVWNYSFDGNANGTVDVNFYRGIVVTSSERHRPADSAYPEFYNIELHHWRRHLVQLQP